MPEPIPDVIVELLALGELEEAEAAEVRARLEADGDPRLEAIERSNAEVLARYPVHEEVEQLTRALRAGSSPVTPVSRAARRPRRGLTVVTAALALAASVALVWAWGPLADGEDTPEPEPERVAVVTVERPPPAPLDHVRHKGTQRLVIHRRGRDAPLGPGDAVEPGDVLQLSYANGARRHGVIVSLDGAGVATLHWPAQRGDPTDLSPGLVRLDYAYELDEAPGFERFFFVAADEPLDVDVVVAAARALESGPDPRSADLALPDAWGQVSLLLIKRTRAE